MYLNYRKINGESDCMEDGKKYTLKITVQYILTITFKEVLCFTK